MSAEAEIAIERSLAASGIGAAAAASGCVPVVDITADGAADLIWDAATTVGFFVVTGHGIDQELIDSAFSSAREFFDQDVEAKESQSRHDAAENAGIRSTTTPSSGRGERSQQSSCICRGREIRRSQGGTSLGTIEDRRECVHCTIQVTSTSSKSAPVLELSIRRRVFK
mmetsp:Transcript_21412/g.59439  ORF Transcript_21412/g.59439 Transcript_21412/m.59439 type:complete len:169 (-) Transcript_21412:909-1415(-)